MICRILHAKLLYIHGHTGRKSITDKVQALGKSDEWDNRDTVVNYFLSEARKRNGSRSKPILTRFSGLFERYQRNF